MTTETRMYQVVESTPKDNYALIVIQKDDLETTRIVLAVDLPAPRVGSQVTVRFELAPPQRPKNETPVCAWCREKITRPKDRVRLGYENMHADCRGEFQTIQLKVQQTEQLIECPF